MVNKINYFKNYINKFYPKDISPIINNNEYKSQDEYKRLIEIINSRDKFSESKKISLIKYLEHNINYKFDDFSLLSWNDRCHNIQSIIEKNKLSLNIICINISVLIPYYTIYILKTERESINGFKRKFTPTLNNTLLEEYRILVNFIEKVLEKKFFLKKFPIELLNTKIDDVGFEDIDVGKLTYFNAFFLNTYDYTRYF